MDFPDLDDRTQQFMLEEVDHDEHVGSLYISPRLSVDGRRDYPALLRAAIESGDEQELVRELGRPGRLNGTELRQGKPVKIGSNAAQMLGEGEFNRFYIRGVCRRAIEEGIAAVEIYRARPSSNPRPESQARIGVRVAPAALLEDLRTNPGGDTVLGVPGGPNSGISVKLPQQ